MILTRLVQSSGWAPYKILQIKIRPKINWSLLSKCNWKFSDKWSCLLQNIIRNIGNFLNLTTFRQNGRTMPKCLGPKRQSLPVQKYWNWLWLPWPKEELNCIQISNLWICNQFNGIKVKSKTSFLTSSWTKFSCLFNHIIAEI